MRSPVSLLLITNRDTMVDVSRRAVLAIVVEAH